MAALGWFTLFRKDLDKKLDNQPEHFDGEIDNLTDTVFNLQQSVKAAEETRKKKAKKRNRKSAQQMLTDDLEVIILGLHIAFTESYEVVTRMLYEELGMSQKKILLFDYWDNGHPPSLLPMLLI